jgi:hypothetical protein
VPPLGPPEPFKKLINWLDAPVFDDPRHPAVAATAWLEGSTTRWSGALSYKTGRGVVLVPALKGKPPVLADWVFEGFLGPQKESTDQSFLHLGFGVHRLGVSKVSGFADAASLDPKFKPTQKVLPTVLANEADPVGVIRGIIEIGDGIPGLMYTLGPIYWFNAD